MGKANTPNMAAPVHMGAIKNIKRDIADKESDNALVAQWMRATAF